MKTTAGYLAGPRRVWPSVCTCVMRRAFLRGLVGFDRGGAVMQSRSVVQTYHQRNALFRLALSSCAAASLAPKPSFGGSFGVR